MHFSCHVNSAVLLRRDALQNDRGGARPLEPEAPRMTLARCLLSKTNQQLVIRFEVNGEVSTVSHEATTCEVYR